jgi:ubiquinone/menaquinone biosynthesis C-methylase UbiE
LLIKERKLFEGKRVLHFAPERQMRKYLLDAKTKQYVTADLFEVNVDMKQDIENLTLPERSFDVIVCSHVLEHVDDRKALAQMFKVLDRGGVALLMTPIIEGWDESYENSAVKSEADRIVHFGQRDHVRYFGRDLRQRIKDAGFKLEEYTAMEPFVQQHALMRGEKIFMAWRP